MINYHSQKQLRRRKGFILTSKRDIIHHGGEGTDDRKAWWQDQEAGWSYFIFTQKAEQEEEVVQIIKPQSPWRLERELRA